MIDFMGVESSGHDGHDSRKLFFSIVYLWLGIVTVFCLSL